MTMQGYLRDRSASWAWECIGALALLMLVLPLMVFVAVAIKCDSKGPILVGTNRVTGGRRYTASKFRCTQMTTRLNASPASAGFSGSRVSRTFPSSTTYFVAR
jgi:lipopolysaccharide/colanic/teichoic acid biosynthesis glycosyltransferase